MKRFLFIPPAIFPYIVLTALAIIAFSEQIMEVLFFNNAFLLLLVVLIVALLSLILTVVTVVLSIVQKWDAVFISKYVMIIKLIQIPAYLAIFLLGLLCLLTIFTIPFTLLLFLIDLIVILMTGTLGFAASFGAWREKKLSTPNAILFAVLQFLFCIDVVASIILYSKVKKHKSLLNQIEFQKKWGTP